MKIEITGRGIYGKDGKPVPIGTVLEVKSEPTGWRGRYRVIGKAEGKTAVTNPAPSGAYAVKEKSAGWYVITQDGKEVTKSLRKDDVEGFDKLSDADKAKFVEANKAE